MAGRPAEAMREILRLLLQGQVHEAERIVRGEFLAWQRALQPSAGASARRTVADIEQGAEPARRRRLEHERRVEEAREAKQRAERERYLAGLADKADRVWREIDTTLQCATGVAYDQALERLQELSEALAAHGRDTEFRRGLAALLKAHDKRPAWRKRLEKVGFM